MHTILCFATVCIQLWAVERKFCASYNSNVEEECSCKGKAERKQKHTPRELCAQSTTQKVNRREWERTRMIQSVGIVSRRSLAVVVVVFDGCFNCCCRFAFSLLRTYFALLVLIQWQYRKKPNKKRRKEENQVYWCVRNTSEPWVSVFSMWISNCYGSNKRAIVGI